MAQLQADSPHGHAAEDLGEAAEEDLGEANHQSLALVGPQKLIPLVDQSQLKLDPVREQQAGGLARSLLPRPTHHCPNQAPRHSHVEEEEQQQVHHSIPTLGMVARQTSNYPEPDYQAKGEGFHPKALGLHRSASDLQSLHLEHNMQQSKTLEPLRILHNHQKQHPLGPTAYLES